MQYSEAIDVSDCGKDASTVAAARAIFFSNRAMARLKMELYDSAAVRWPSAQPLAPVSAFGLRFPRSARPASPLQAMPPPLR